MLERPPGGTTIRRPAGLMGTSSGVGGPAMEGKGGRGRHEKGGAIRFVRAEHKKQTKIYQDASNQQD